MKKNKNCQKMLLKIDKSIIYFILNLHPLTRSVTYSKLYLAGKIWGGNVRWTISYTHIFRKQGFERLCTQISLHKFKKWSWFNGIIPNWDNMKVFAKDICVYCQLQVFYLSQFKGIFSTLSNINFLSQKNPS